MQDLVPAPAINNAGGVHCLDNHQDHQNKLANFIMFFENSQYGRYSCDSSVVSKVFDKRSTATTTTLVNKRLNGNNDFVVLRSSLVSPSTKSRRDGNSLSRSIVETTATPSPTTMSAPTTNSCRLDISSLTTPLIDVESNQRSSNIVEPPRPAPRMSLLQANTQSDSFKSDQVTKSRVATLKRDIFSVKLQTPEITSKNQHKLPNISNQSQLTSKLKSQMFNPLTATTKNSDSHHVKRHEPARKLPPTPSEHHGQQLSRHDIHRMAPSIADGSNELSSDNDDDDDEEDAGTDNGDAGESDGEDYLGTTAESADKPRKPGKLDLRQFDNITTAIGKLNVQPLSASPTSNATISQTTSPPSTHVFGSSRASSSKSGPAISEQQPNSGTQTSANSRKLSNLRHGRAVAPPKLPTNSLLNNSSLCRSSRNDENSSQNRMAQSNDDESAIDSSRSPIAQRLFKLTKDHKGRLSFMEAESTPRSD